jgi:hypothetical protein
MFFSKICCNRVEIFMLLVHPHKGLFCLHPTILNLRSGGYLKFHFSFLSTMGK